ncbi:cation:proton antiporter [Actinophytocola oryzae]|uniref:Sodium/proton antiporter (CPA1 family) n=1 Tax=Actinophytocola oryzae TaxID=502181 RepID=A0A4R7W1P2_9PSEU|nr:sodium:proton antiporter [Actinophytocola oryzae]TDV56476.1 sodium/proton antiporter (CPA1 family) [Actinophytocola oryzae]
MREPALLAVMAVLIIVAVSYFAPRLGVAAPVLLVLVGMGCGRLPGAPDLFLEPEWILAGVLPPLLYAAAVNVPVLDFRRDFGTIGALSVLLVLVSAFGTGLLIWWLVPDIGFATAVALGAVVSPPDAVAATSVGKRLGLPPRLVTILEGEGLVNDATALVLLRTAVAATAGVVSFRGALGEFAFAVFVGIAVGVLVGHGSVWVRSRIREQPVLTTAISFVVPFLAFLPAEELHASGVIAVVTAGLITGHKSASRFTAHDRISERTNWRTIQLLLENGVFLLMGFEITAVVSAVHESGDGVWTAIGFGLLTTLTLVVLRVVFVIPLVAMLRHQQQDAGRLIERIEAVLDRLTARGPHPDRPRRYERATVMLRRRHADAVFFANEGLGWRGGAVLAWSGMRGVVTLAAAQSLPTDVPHRAELVLVAFTVAIVTLVVQGGTLPVVVKRLGIQGTDADQDQRELAHLTTELQAATQSLLESPTLRRENGDPFDDDLLDQTRERNLAFAESIEKMLTEQAPDSPLQQRRELQRLLVDAQQNALLDARASGTYSSHVLERAQNLIDTMASRFGGPDTRGVR